MQDVQRQLLATVTDMGESLDTLVCGNSGRPLGLPLGALHWRGPGLVPVSHLGEDQLLVALGGLHLPYQ